MDLEALIQEVKDKVGALITKPKMADKLLSKPPFRYYHFGYTFMSPKPR